VNDGGGCAIMLLCSCVEVLDHFSSAEVAWEGTEGVGA
jgi:hypothetical protein